MAAQVRKLIPAFNDQAIYRVANTICFSLRALYAGAEELMRMHQPLVHLLGVLQPRQRASPCPATP